MGSPQTDQRRRVEITADTNVGDLIDRYPEVLQVLEEYGIRMDPSTYILLRGSVREAAEYNAIAELGGELRGRQRRIGDRKTERRQREDNTFPGCVIGSCVVLATQLSAPSRRSPGGRASVLRMACSLLAVGSSSSWATPAPVTTMDCGRKG